METPHPDILAVKTNWILDVALHQEEASDVLLAQTEQDLIQLLLPSFCIAESIKTFDEIREKWTALEQAIKAATREILRSPQLAFSGARLLGATDALAEVSDATESEFWRVIERITRATTLLEPTPEVVVLTAEIRTLLELDAADASVLATVVAARRADRCRKFMSRDQDFRSEAVPPTWRAKDSSSSTVLIRLSVRSGPGCGHADPSAVP